jgi:hypothetical protein
MAAMRIIDAPTTTLAVCDGEGWGGFYVYNSPMMAARGCFLPLRVWMSGCEILMSDESLT